MWLANLCFCSLGRLMQYGITYDFVHIAYITCSKLNRPPFFFPQEKGILHKYKFSEGGMADILLRSHLLVVSEVSVVALHVSVQGWGLQMGFSQPVGTVYVGGQA